MTTIRALVEDNTWWSYQPGLDKAQVKTKRNQKSNLTII